jgi:histidinol-phosphate aminotransferase
MSVFMDGFLPGSPGDQQGEVFYKMELPIQPRSEISALPDGLHGAPDYLELERLGLTPGEVLDFSVNSNPYGPSPHVVQALAQIPLDRYPDRNELLLRRSLGDHMRVDFENILVGNGTPEILWMLVVAYIRPGDKVLIIGPTFSRYRRVSLMMGASIDTLNAVEEQGFILEPDDISDRLSQVNYRFVFLCNPNNPTGKVISVEAIERWARMNPSTLFILDEAYFSFSIAANSAIYLKQPNLVVLRSMSKDYGLAGLCLGYAVADKRLLEILTKVRPPHSVNACAQVAGIVALEDQSYHWNCRVRLRSDKKILLEGLERFGCLPASPNVHFFLLPVDNGQVFRRALLRKGMLVRDCASYGLPKYVRISTRRSEENMLLLHALEEMQDFSGD